MLLYLYTKITRFVFMVRNTNSNSDAKSENNYLDKPFKHNCYCMQVYQLCQLEVNTEFCPHSVIVCSVRYSQ
jgi:hypothetical protein